jgi:hypothetical protein
MALGLIAMMLVGFVSASSVLAAAGPFWHHRPIGGEGTGEKIEPKAPENFTGTQGVQNLLDEVAALKVSIVAIGATVSGAIFNSPNQGQIKMTITYKEANLVKPELKECAVIIGTNNVMVIKGHLDWKWNGEPKQLTVEPQTKEQIPELVFTGVEPVQKETSDFRNNSSFTTITLKGTGCGPLAGTFNVEGSQVGFPNRKIEEFNKELSVRTMAGETIKSEVLKAAGEGFLQHDWNGSAFQGIVAGIRIGGNPANLISQTEMETVQQEIAIFEK